ncbi:hypothetical protein BGZ98_001623 [Dissophora globulifera]|nr:hypothetical protein BGZ98_001623 [Dissophora globulifera]
MSLGCYPRAPYYDTSKITTYVSTAVYGILGLSGLLSAFIKTYGLAKNFSVLWWSFTIVVTILSVINIVIVATKEKDALHTVCQNDLLQTDKYSSGVYDPQELSDDVQSCYNVVLTVAGVSLAIQVLVMSICGWVASRYTSEVKHMHDGVAYEHSVPANEQEQHPYKA